MDEFAARLRDPGENEADIDALIAGLSPVELSIAARWPSGAQLGQLPPPGDWNIWLMLAGRGFGKTRAGAEWVHERARAGDATTRIALLGATREEARAVMVEGESGLLAVAPPGERPLWQPARHLLTWHNGAQATLFSGAHPEGLRGPQHHFAWCDEIAKWARPGEVWDNLRLGLRLGEQPRVMVTTTPRPIALLKALVAAPDAIVTRGRTADNRALPDAFVATMTALHGGTRWGRQELEGELIDDVEGALWTRAMLEACRVHKVPALRRVVVGVDPPAKATGDACGIVAAGIDADGRGYVLEDASVAGCSPEGWAQAVRACAARHGADRILAEANNGGDMVSAVLRAADGAMPVRLVHAARGKVARAEPVAALYERGRVAHAGAFAALEDELCGLVAGGRYAGPGRSPDRADALVWALTELMLGRRRAGAPQLRTL